MKQTSGSTNNRNQKARPVSDQAPSSIPGIQPEPLEELNEDERREWRKFTNRMPADWFPPETWPVLAQLCRHVCQARWVGQCLQEVRAGILDPNDGEQLDRLMKLQSLHDREGKAMVALMVKLRLTSQQRIQDDGVARRARAEAASQPEVPPWRNGPGLPQ